MTLRKTLYLFTTFCLATCALATDELEEAGPLVAAFPEHNASDAGAPLEQLPAEIIGMIYGYLTELSDKINLSLASKHLCALRPAFKKVLLHNLEGLRVVFEHSGYLNVNASIDLVVKFKEKPKDIQLPKVQKTQVKTLCLAREFTDYPWTDEDLAALLAGWTQLESADLTGNQKVTKNGLACLPKSLKHLVLNGCSQVSDVGLATVAKLTQLQHLELNRCRRITDIGLATLAVLTALQHLELTHCKQVTDLALGHLVELKELHHLDVSCTQITFEGLEALRARLVHLQYCGLSWAKTLEASLKALTQADLAG